MTFVEIVSVISAAVLLIALFLIPLFYLCELDKRKAQKQLELLDLLKKYFETHE